MTLINEDKLRHLLKQVFGYSDFRPDQLEIIEAVLARRDVLAVMPTGAGKSLCYQLPALYSGQKTVIVSPLVALMDDQTAALLQLGVQVSKIHSGQSRDDNVAQWRLFASGHAHILYLSPERLLQPRMIAALQRLSVGFFVVDEAHCISKWGADFRPDYEELARLKQLFPEAVIAAFTATADKATRADIAGKLTGGNCAVFVKGFDRPNLCLRVLPKQRLRHDLLTFLADKTGQSGLVYCLSRNETDRVCTLLESKGFNAISYHAGKTADYRREAQNRFMSEDGVVMVATIAFGMGIDKPDIRYVVHVSMPGSMEAFYQEIGRAGRDGAPAETVIFYGLQDIVKRQKMIFDGDGDERHKLLEYKRLDALTGYCETTGCRRLALLSYFDEAVAGCDNCDNCMHPPEVEDCTSIARPLITAIKQTGQYFGAGHIIDVVRGVETTKVKARGHHRLSVFGTEADQPKQLLQAIIRQLIAGNMLTVNLEKYGALQIAEKGYRLLEVRERFMAKSTSATATSAPAHRQIAHPSGPPSDVQNNPQLLAELKRVRMELAKARSMPAYVIFSDKTLMQMANEMPVTQDQFLSVNGVGKTKLKKFHAPFSNVIATYINAGGNVTDKG